MKMLQSIIYDDDRSEFKSASFESNENRKFPHIEWHTYTCTHTNRKKIDYEWYE